MRGGGLTWLVGSEAYSLSCQRLAVLTGATESDQVVFPIQEPDFSASTS